MQKHIPMLLIHTTPMSIKMPTPSDLTLQIKPSMHARMLNSKGILEYILIMDLEEITMQIKK